MSSAGRFFGPLSSWATCSYANRCLTRIALLQNRVPVTAPDSSKSMYAVIVNRTRSACRLASPFEMISGSIGRTRPGRYTLLPRARASRSRGVPSGTKCETSAICTPSVHVPSLCFSSEIASSKSRGINRVDRDDRLAGQIFASFEIRVVEGIGDLANLASTSSGKSVARANS